MRTRTPSHASKSRSPGADRVCRKGLLCTMEALGTLIETRALREEYQNAILDDLGV